MKLYVDSFPYTATDVIPGFGDDWAQYVKVSRQRKGVSKQAVSVTLPAKGLDEKAVWEAFDCHTLRFTTAIEIARALRYYLAVCRYLNLRPSVVGYEPGGTSCFLPGPDGAHREYAAYLSILDVLFRFDTGGVSAPVVYAAPNHVSAGAMLEEL